MLRRPESIPPRFVSFAWRYRGCARRFAPTGCGRPLLRAWTFGHPVPSRGSSTETSGFSQVPGRTSWCTCPGRIPRGTLDARPLSAPRVLPSARPTASAPRSVDSRGWLPRPAHSLSTLRSDGLPRRPRKTRFRWVANPCRVGLAPTRSTTKGFRFDLLHPSSLPRLTLARGTSLRTRRCRYGRRGSGNVEETHLGVGLTTTGR